MKTWRWAILGLVLLGLAGAAYFLIWGRSNAQTSPLQPQVVAVTRGNLEVGVSASGNIVLPRQENLTFGVAGTASKTAISRITVKEGDRVTQGQILAELDLAPLQRAVAQAKADLEKAKDDLDKAKNPYDEADLATAEANLLSAKDRLKTAQDPYSALDLAKAEANLASAQLQVETARQALARAQDPVRSGVGQAEKALADAQFSRESAQKDLDFARTDWEIKRQDAESKYQDVLKDYLDKVKGTFGLELKEADLSRQPKDAFTEQTMNPDFLYAWQYLMPRAGKTPTFQDLVDATQALWETQKAAKESLDNILYQREKGLASAEDKLKKAQNAVDEAKASLDEAKARLALDVASAKKLLAQAEAAVKDAEEKLADIKAGADPVEVANALAAVKAAEKKLADIKAGADPVAVALKENQLTVAQSNLDETLKNIEKASLKAPFAGVVEEVIAKEGDEVTTNANILVLVDPSLAEIDALVDETDVAQVRVGQKARVTLEALTGQELAGTVSLVSLLGKSQQGVVSYKVTIALEPVTRAGQVSRPQGSQTPTAGAGQASTTIVLRNGLTATATIITQSRENVLLVPNRAVKRTTEGRTVQVLVNGQVQTRTVRTGLSDDQSTEVTEGLNEGDQVAIEAAAPASRQSVPGAGTQGMFGGQGGGFR